MPGGRDLGGLLLHEATDLQGTVIFLGTASSRASTANAAAQEALVEVVVKAKGLGFCRILFMCSSRRLAQVCNFNYTPSW